MMKIDKRIVSVLLAVILVLGLVPGRGLAAESAGQTCGENAFWHFENGTLTISGTGPVEDFVVSVDGMDVWNPKPWDQFAADVRRLVIGEGITQLGSAAFKDLKNLEEVSLPDSLIWIGNFAFYSCWSLKTVDLPEGLAVLGQQAFADCQSLAAIEIPASVTFVDACVFERCAALSDAYFRSNPNMGSFGLGNSVFNDCSSLEEIRVEDGHIALRSIDGALYFALSDGSLSLNDYPSGRKNAEFRIADGTFQISQTFVSGNPYLETVIIPDTVTSWGSWAIQWCENVKTIRFEGGVPESRPWVFLSGDLNATISYPCDEPGWKEILSCDNWKEQLGIYGDIVWEVSHSGGEAAEVIEPTCTEGGYTVYVCQCGDSYVGDITDAKGHSFGPWVIDTESVQNDVSGVKHRVCECGDRETTTYTNPLVDIPNGKYYTKPVFWAYENGITKGKTANEFQKDAECTRKQIVMFLWRAAGQPEPESMECDFDDVKNDSFRKAILWAVEKGITNGTSATKFSPDAPCTRKQIVMFLWRYFGKPALTEEQQKPEFTDMPGGQFRTAILWAFHNGITTGKTDTTFAPDATCTRGQIVTFLYRAMAES